MFERLMRKLGYIKIPTYDEAMEKMRDVHQVKYGYRGVSAGEFFGCRRMYEGVFGIKCPDYDRVG